MTINDPILSPLATKVHKNERLIDYLTREGKRDALFLAYKNIADAAEQAMERINRMQWPDQP
jgi:hypothetical protein